MNGGFTVDTWSDDEDTTNVEEYVHGKYAIDKVFIIFIAKNTLK